MTFPDLQNGHAGDRTVRVGLGRRIDDVIRTNHHRDVNIRKIAVDLVHFKNDVIRDSGLRQQDIHVSWHTPGDRVNTKTHVDVPGPQGRRNFVHYMLGLCNRHAITGNDHHLFGICEKRGCFLRIDRHNFALDLSGCHTLAPAGTETTGDHREEFPVHCATHDVTQDGTARANQRSGNNQEIVVKHEAGRCCGPAGVAVQHRNHDRHVCTADRHDHVDAKKQCYPGHDQKRCHSTTGG